MANILVYVGGNSISDSLAMRPTYQVNMSTFELYVQTNSTTVTLFECSALSRHIDKTKAFAAGISMCFVASRQNR